MRSIFWLVLAVLMGQLKHEGDAIDVAAPAAQEIFKGELYRIDGWTGISMAHILPADTERNFSMEVRPRVWYVLVPAATAVARGDLLYWTAGAGFKRGNSVDLTATITGSPIAKVEEIRDANGVAGIRLLNTGA